MSSKESRLYLIPHKVQLIGAQFRIFDVKQKMQHSINSLSFKRRFWALLGLDPAHIVGQDDEQAFLHCQAGHPHARMSSRLSKGYKRN
jgi:hypothetical protein